MSQTTHHSTLPGRANDQALLRDALDGAMLGNGCVVLMSGDAGIGKTTLVSWLRSEAEQQGLEVLYGACYDHLTTPPFCPWFNALERFRRSQGRSGKRTDLQLTGLPPGNSSHATDSADMFERVGGLLDRLQEHGPVALILEDVHWADHASLELLRFVTRHVRKSRLLVVHPPPRWS